MVNATPPARDDGEPAPPAGPLDGLAERLSWLGAVLAGVCIVAILAIICLEVALRPFRISLLVTDEIGGYLNAAAVFLGLAYSLRHGSFIRVELVYDALKGGIKQLVRWTIVVVSTVYVAILLYFAVRHVIYAYEKDTRAVSVLDTPEWIPQSVMVVGLVLLLIQLIAYIAGRVRRIP